MIQECSWRVLSLNCNRLHWMCHLRILFFIDVMFDMVRMLHIQCWHWRGQNVFVVLWLYFKHMFNFVFWLSVSFYVLFLIILIYFYVYRLALFKKISHILLRSVGNHPKILTSINSNSVFHIIFSKIPEIFKTKIFLMSKIKLSPNARGATNLLNS